MRIPSAPAQAANLAVVEAVATGAVAVGMVVEVGPAVVLGTVGLVVDGERAARAATAKVRAAVDAVAVAAVGVGEAASDRVVREEIDITRTIFIRLM